MGKLFSYEAIEAGQIPQPADFELASQTFQDAAQLEHEIGIFDGSFIFGSVAFGTAARRSDFDCFIALKRDDIFAYKNAKGVVEEVVHSAQTPITVVPIIHNRKSLAHGYHEIDRLFGRHLSGSHRIVIGNDPSTYMRYSTRPLSEIISAFLFQKKRKLTNGYTYKHPLDVENNSVQRALELPISVGRKILQAFAEEGRPINELGAVEKSADKSLILAESREVFEGLGVDATFERLVEANEDYNELLNATIGGRVSREKYNRELTALHGILPVAINWVEQVEQSLLPILNYQAASR